MLYGLERSLAGVKCIMSAEKTKFVTIFFALFKIYMTRARAGSAALVNWCCVVV